MFKPEFPNLLPAGFHKFTVAALAGTFVEPFAYSQRRPMLLAGLRKFAAELTALGVKGELWFDGSFVCEKNEPDDVDLVVIIDTASLADFTDEKHSAVQRVLDNATAKAMFGCDAYCVLSTDDVGVSYWRGWYGFKRDGKTAKGIGYISL
jgi:hypothetical protein